MERSVTFPATRNDKPRYWAFISYSHHDRRVARWCRDELARQAVPSSMRDRVQGSPSHFAAVFLDEETLAAAPFLSEELQVSLRLSSHLIVICSPFAVASSYVNDEIRYFQSLGLRDRILCVVASGVPNATDDGRPHLECFPEALRLATTDAGPLPIALGRRPLAAVMGDESTPEKQRVLRQLTSGLLGISDQALRNMESRQKAVLRLAYTGAALCFLFFLLAFELPWHTYSRGYVRVNGVWREVDKISSWEASLVGDRYEFIRWGFLRKPHKVEFRNGFGGYPAKGLADVLGKNFDSDCTTSRATEANFTYEGDRITEEELVDQYGTKLETMTYAPAAPVGHFFQNAGFGCSQSHAGVYLVKFHRDAQGFDDEVRFLDDHTTSGQPEPRANDDGVYGFRFTYDKQGYVTSTTYLSIAGKPQISRNGYAVKKEKYDRHGWSVETRYLSPTGEPVLNKDGVAVERRIFDSHGSVLEESNFGLDDRLIASASGEAVAQIKRGSHGEALSMSFLDNDRNPVSGKNGYAGWKVKFDSRGNEVEVRYLDTSSKPAASIEKIAGFRRFFNSDGNPTKVRYFGVDGKPAFSDDGFAQWEESYDERGNPVESRYLGLNGESVRNAAGTSIFRKSYDAQNQVVSGKSYDPQGQPILSNGYFEKRYTYDGSGNETERQNFAPDGQVVNDNIGVARETRRYDRAGLNVEKRTFGQTGQPAVTNDMGNASVERYEYDALGRTVKTSYFDADGNPAASNLNISSWTETLDAKGRVVEVAFFGTERQPVKNKGNAFRYRREYDSRGHEVLLEYEDASGNPMLGSEGYAYTKDTVNALGSVTSERYFDVTMQPVTINGGNTAGWDATFNLRGDKLSQRYVGPDDKPAAEEHGIAAFTYEYNQSGDQTAVHLWNLKNKPALNGDGSAGWNSKYDERHQEIELTQLGLDGRPAISPRLRWATKRMKYNDSGLSTEASYFDQDGHPVVNTFGYAIERSTYDAQGNIAESRYFDQAGQPAREREAARIMRMYNKFGQRIEWRFYDVDDKLVRNPETGRAIARDQYDEAGRVVLETSFDEQDHPVNRLDQKYWSKATTYSSNGKATSVCTTVSRIVVPCPAE